MKPRSLVSLVCVAVGACSGSESPANQLVFDQPALILELNPAINCDSREGFANVTDVREGIRVESDDGASAVTDARGIAVLSPIEPGLRTLNLEADLVSASMDIEIPDRGIMIKMAGVDGGQIRDNRETRFDFAEAVEVTPSMSHDEVANALSNESYVFMHAGSYAGDFDIANGGFRLVLIGDITAEGGVVFEGNITHYGGGAMLGVTIRGDAMGATNAWIYNSRFEGVADIRTVDMLVNNQFCTDPMFPTGSIAAMGNEGLCPLDAPPDCP